MGSDTHDEAMIRKTIATAEDATASSAKATELSEWAADAPHPDERHPLDAINASLAAASAHRSAAIAHERAGAAAIYEMDIIAGRRRPRVPRPA